jgi:hypothetical protein
MFQTAVDILFITVRSFEDRDHKTEIKSVMGRAKPEMVSLSAKVAQLIRLFLNALRYETTSPV